MNRKLQPHGDCRAAGRGEALPERNKQDLAQWALPRFCKLIYRSFSRSRTKSAQKSVIILAVG